MSAEPVKGSITHVIQMILLLAGGAGFLILSFILLWWGGFWGIGTAALWIVIAAGVSHQIGIGRGFRLGHDRQKISMSDEGSW